MKSNVLKRKYIEVAFAIIQEEGRDGVTIRRLARILDCNMASLYRCFHDLDELFLYTGLKYVRGYLQDVRELLLHSDNNLELYLSIWECFMVHALKNPKIYDSLFFGKYSSKLDYASEEYYNQLFPEEIIEFDDETREVLMKGSFQTGDSSLSKTLVKCVADGLLKEEDRIFIDTLCLQTFKGYLKDFLDKRRGPQMIQQTTEEMMSIFRAIISKFQVQDSDNQFNSR